MLKDLPNLPDSPGVYIFRDTDRKTLYIGKSVSLRSRVSSYFQKGLHLPPKTRELVKHIVSVETIETASEIEALLLEAALIQTIKPKFNIQLKDDKNYSYIEVTDSFYKRTDTNVNVRTQSRQRNIYHTDTAYPKVGTARKAGDPNAIYFGPFPKGTVVRKVIKILRKMFGWCQYKSIDEVGRSTSPCFYYHIGQCPGYCAGKISYEEYLEHVDRIIQFLRGDRKYIIKDLKAKMDDAAKIQEYEKAQQFKSLLEKLEYITQEFISPQHYVGSPILEQEKFYFARKELTEALGAVNLEWSAWLRNLERVEAYDISNTQGTNATASMVVFIEGKPETDLYRHFKIRTVDGPDDFKMMGEALHRRLAYLISNERNKAELSFSQIPQLLVIDGGKGQLSEVLKQLDRYKLSIPVIGLAKKEETIIVPKQGPKRRTYVSVRLPLDSPALQLVQHIRDEAHRFAKRYHKKLRRKSSFD